MYYTKELPVLGKLISIISSSILHIPDLTKKANGLNRAWAIPAVWEYITCTSFRYSCSAMVDKSGWSSPKHYISEILGRTWHVPRRESSKTRLRKMGCRQGISCELRDRTGCNPSKNLRGNRVERWSTKNVLRSPTPPHKEGCRGTFAYVERRRDSYIHRHRYTLGFWSTAAV